MRGWKGSGYIIEVLSSAYVLWLKKQNQKDFRPSVQGHQGQLGEKKRRKIGNKDTKIKKDINRKKWKIQKKVVKIDKLGIIEDKSYRIQK